MFDSKHLGENIKMARKNAGISQQALALKILHQSASDISRFEAGSRVPTIEVLTSIADACKTTASRLLDADDTLYNTEGINKSQATVVELQSDIKQMQTEVAKLRSEIMKMRIAVNQLLKNCIEK